jgi:hypothetical protein
MFFERFPHTQAHTHRERGLFWLLLKFKTIQEHKPPHINKVGAFCFLPKDDLYKQQLMDFID